MSPGPDASTPPTAAVVSVGDELLFGETNDTNGSWLARELSTLGFSVLRRWVVGDVRKEIQDAVGSALERAELVLVSGGLGPTPDDLTRESVAGLMGIGLETDPDLLEALESRYRAMGYPALPEESRSMALRPMEGRLLANALGAAPGMALTGPQGRICVLLPGVPREMRQIFRSGVVDLAREKFHGRLSPVTHRVIHTAGIPESALSEEVKSVLPADMGPVSLAFLPDLRGVRLRLSARGQDLTDDAEILIRDLEERLEPVVSDYRYEAESGDLAEAVGAALVRSGFTLAVAESCTGGLISKRITDQPGSSRFFRGGVIAYHNSVKEGTLGVDGGSLRGDGAVSGEVAEGMARGVADLLGSDVGIGVTGVAGPSGGTPEKPVGTVWYAVSLENEAVTRKGFFSGDREAVRERAAQATLSLLLRLLEEKEH